MKNEVAGFRFGAVEAGLKPGGGPDFALIAADDEVAVAAAFTRNRVKGAPVLLSQERVKAGFARAVMVTAGNANACTGKGGLDDARELTRAIAKELGADERRVLAAGTGRIGVRLPIAALLGRTPDLCAVVRASGFDEFAHAILTTDRQAKVSVSEVAFGKVRTRLLGCAKGSSQIAPNLATTLAFVATDAALDGRWLRQTLKEEVDATFNDISVDGETSPCDSVFLLASGRAANRPLDGGAPGRAFRSALRDVLDDLSTQVVRDGAGATRLVTIEIAGAANPESARLLSRRIGASPLVKAALGAARPEWGRVLVVLGNAGVELDPERVDIEIAGVPLMRSGVPVGEEAEARAAAAMRKDTFTVRVHLHRGHATARHLTCDLTADYLRQHTHDPPG